MLIARSNIISNKNDQLNWMINESIISCRTFRHKTWKKKEKKNRQRQTNKRREISVITPSMLIIHLKWNKSHPSIRYLLNQA